MSVKVSSRKLAKRYTKDDLNRAFARGQLYMQSRIWKEFRTSDLSGWDFKAWASWCPVAPTLRKP